VLSNRDVAQSAKAHTMWADSADHSGSRTLDHCSAPLTIAPFASGLPGGQGRRNRDRRVLPHLLDPDLQIGSEGEGFVVVHKQARLILDAGKGSGRAESTTIFREPGRKTQ
jgi:hypothetical protein